MYGRLLNSLSYRIRQEEHEWKSTNRVRREFRYGWFQRAFVALAKRPVVNSVEQAILVALAMVAVGLELPPIKGLATRFNTLENILSYFVGLWSVQAAIVALVYPIVIAFVTLLLQRRHNAKARLYIYLHDSAAIYAGLSALFLTAVMGVQYLLLPQFALAQAASWVLIDSVWFTWNSIATIWFLYRTFEFLRPDVRAGITTRYTVNIAWHNEVLRNLQYHAFGVASANNWLPGPAYGSNDADEKPSILAHYVGRDMGKSAVEVHFAGKREVADIRFRLLAWVAKRWLKRAKPLTSTANPSGGFFDRAETPVLVFPVLPGQPYEESVPLCRVVGQVSLTNLEKWLVLKAFVLTRKRKLPSVLGIREILADLEAEAVSAITIGEEAAFDEILDELIELHCVLLNAGICTDVAGKPDNYAHLPDRAHVFERPTHEIWSRTYFGLYEAAVKQLPSNADFFDHMAHVPARLFRRLRDTRSQQILAHLLRLSPILAGRLGTWWARSAEEQGKLEHSYCAPTLLNPPLLSTHRSALGTLVGAWESIKSHDFPPDRSETPSWAELTEAVVYYEHHLTETLIMLMHSVWRGDQEASEWLVDSLLKWWETLRYRFDETSFFLRRARFLTIELLAKEWSEAKEVIDTRIVGFSEAGAPSAVFAACLRNYWIDVCCVALYVQLTWAKDCECAKSLSARLAGSLLAGRPLRPGGDSIGTLKPFEGASDVLIAILRQYHAEGGYRRGYRARLDKLVERISGLRKPEMIPGRVYSGWGADDLDSVRDGQLMLICLTVKNGWRPIANVEKTIRQWLIEDNSSVRELARDLKQWIERVDHSEFTGMEHIHACVVDAVETGEKPRFEDSIARLKEGLQELSDFIDKVQKEAVRDAAISAARLHEVAEWSSRLAFSSENAGLPIWLFRDVTTSTSAQRERSLILKNMNKGEFTDPEFVQRAVNEGDWYAKTVRDHVAAGVMADVLHELRVADVVADTAASYWQELTRTADEIHKASQRPVLLVENATIPKWIWDWTLTEHDERAPRPEGLVLQRLKESQGPGYLGNFNEVAVYVAPLPPGASYVIAREVLDSIQFRVGTGNLYVNVEVEPIAGKDELIDLRLTWAYTLTVGQSQVTRLVYKPRPDGKTESE